MIVSNLQHSARIEPLHPLFKQLFDYVKSHDLLHTPCGRIELDGNNLFINTASVKLPDGITFGNPWYIHDMDLENWEIIA